MDKSIIAFRLQRSLHQKVPLRRLAVKSKGGPESEKKTKKSDTISLGHLQSILTNMKVEKSSNIFSKINKFGNSDLFDYATNKRFSQKELINEDLETWNRLMRIELEGVGLKLPVSGFDELISLTEQGRLWKFPIDNEQGLDDEKNVPFEEHIFLDDYLKEFPDNEYIQSFMSLVVAGLAKNHWMTVDRKREIINYYKRYFEDRRQAYKDRGFDF